MNPDFSTDQRNIQTSLNISLPNPKNSSKTLQEHIDFYSASNTNELSGTGELTYNGGTLPPLFSKPEIVILNITQGVTKIASSGNKAEDKNQSRIFQHLPNLTTVTLPTSYEDIKPYTYSNCTSLHTVNLPDTVTSISQFAFGGCAKLVDVEIPYECSVNNLAFFKCRALEVLAKGSGVLTVVDYCRLKWRKRKANELVRFKSMLFLCCRRFDVVRSRPRKTNQSRSDESESMIDKSSILWVIHDLITSDDAKRKIMEYL